MLTYAGLQEIARIAVYPSVEAVQNGRITLVLNEEPVQAGSRYRLDTRRNCLEIAGVSGFMEVNW
ncbi:MAG: hypothetical protein PHT33_00305 [bacterium]|nr:hypothetical protein [bacterium]